MWILPISAIVVPILLAIPVSRYLAWIMNGNYHPPKLLAGVEARLNSGPQSWKQYAAAMVVFHFVMFVFSFVILAVQAIAPMNSLGRGSLCPTTVLHCVAAFITNTDLQHYSGDQHFSLWSQFFFTFPNFFTSASIGFCCLVLIIRCLRSDPHGGNFFVDMWRVMAYIFLPVAFVFGILCVQQGAPMNFTYAQDVQTLEPGAMGADEKGQPKPQTLITGPLAAFIPMKQLGTNGGGYYGMNSCQPYENPTGLINWFQTVAMMLFPMSLVLMFGRMLHRMRHAWVIFSVMQTLMVATVIWTIYFDTLKPNPGLTAQAAGAVIDVPDKAAPGGKKSVDWPAVAGLPVDQHLGNLEGKELRFGTSAGATFAAITVCVTDGGVNCEHDSLNPIAAISPFTGMWLNCIYGGKGVGMINMLLFIITGIFVAGQMVGRTPEYLGKKIGGREMKLAMIAVLMHPIMILFPTGLFAGTDWGLKSTSNPGPHGFSQIVYQFSSASANNGSAFDGLGVSYGLNNNQSPPPAAVAYDIATTIVIIIGRLVPILAPIAMAGFLGAKKSVPFGPGTLRDDTPTFGLLILGTILIIGALLFLPVAALGPLAEHLGPIPFGG
ncbi:MAG TPA: potassium-transporting ATPase subunit KdpA [Planctomycetota bacterium]|jgi:K+-transporting ATPase ATPase A chain|nr:potassium-transporting ATPase subunit KdpA [Planctomycetota bacterium]